MTDRKKRAESTNHDDDRRRAPRHDATHLGSVITRVIGGGEVKLLDFSRSGVLIESDTRLAIGAKATIRLTTTDASLTVRGEVVRSKVAGVNGTLLYHTALQLEDDLTALEKNVPGDAIATVQTGQIGPPADEKAPPHRAAASGEPGRVIARDPELAQLTNDLSKSLAAIHGDGSEHAIDEDPDTGVDAHVDPILEFLATVPHDLAELRRRAAVNNW
jgi:hypothetical protein